VFSGFGGLGGAMAGGISNNPALRNEPAPVGLMRNDEPAWRAMAEEFEPRAPSPAPMTCVVSDPAHGVLYGQADFAQTFHRYDAETNAWTTLAPAPVFSGNNGGAALLNGRIYTVYAENSSLGVYDIASNKGIGAYDQPFNNTTSFVFELPVGRGRWIGGNMHKILDGIFGGWTLSGVNTMTSGQPITFRYGPSPVTNNLPTFLGGVALRPNASCDPTNREARPNPVTGYFIRSCLTAPSATAPFGNVGRNTARSDNYFNLDLAVQKQFRLPITEFTRIELRAEFFNAFNRTNFQAANSDITSAAFGNSSSTFAARQIQLALKVSF
jgi:hypothetical protein